MNPPPKILSVVAELQLLRLNVLPPYTADGDEDERDYTEYVSFYESNIDVAISTIEAYIGRMESLLMNRESPAAFEDYLAARRDFIANFPFCTDEFPSACEPQYAQVCDSLKRVFAGNAPGSFGDSDLGHLHRYRDGLVTLREYFKEQKGV